MVGTQPRAESRSRWQQSQDSGSGGKICKSMRLIIYHFAPTWCLCFHAVTKQWGPLHYTSGLVKRGGCKIIQAFTHLIIYVGLWVFLDLSCTSFLYRPNQMLGKNSQESYVTSSEGPVPSIKILSLQPFHFVQISKQFCFITAYLYQFAWACTIVLYYQNTIFFINCSSNNKIW